MEYAMTSKGGVWDEVKKGRSRGHRAEEDEELLIFGYSCKLFRDDEKATYIDMEHHLIPWMGDSNLMIDRFDVRGALYDLKEAESKGKPFEETATEAELKEEEICNQERYLALYHDENQLHIYREEEAKRLQAELMADGSAYYQVGFDYTAPLVAEVPQPSLMLEGVPVHASLPPSSNINDQSTGVPVEPEPVIYNPNADEDIFIPPPELSIPTGMDVPATVKQNKIIVKTARFVVSQGGQMEIVIKTKQAGNPMFNFLAFDNSLNSYYKHLVHTIRNGRYKFDDPPPKIDQNDPYLHPNLSQSVKPDLTPGAVSSPSRPSPHCAYSKLITKIREKQIASALEDPEFHSPVAPLSPVTQATPLKEKENDVPPTPSSTAVPKVNNPIVGLVDYPSFNQTADGSSDMEESEPSHSKRESFRRTVSRLKTHDYSNIKWPPPDVQMVIDKMASYIIKNGTVFEEVVRNRDDPRFMFLRKDHEYHPYYQCKMQLYNEVYGDIFKNVSKGGKISEWKKKTSGCSSKKESQNDKGRTISFSIKSREQEVSVTSHTTFPIESSTSEEDEEMDEDEREQRRHEREKRRQERKLKADKEKKEREEYLRKERLKREEERRRERMEDSSSGNEDLYDIFKYAQEMEREKNRRSISPDNTNPHSKQEERKKKAAVFLSKLKDTKEEKKNKTRPIYGPQLPPELSSALSTSVTQSPTSSRASSDGERPPPLPIDFSQPPPPPPRSPSPLEMTEPLSISEKRTKKKSKSPSRVRSESPVNSKLNMVNDSSSIAAVLLASVNDLNGSKHSLSEHSESVEKSSHKSRGHKKQSRQRSESRSSSTRRDRKKRKRSHYRRKKHRSRSRSRSRAHSKSRRSSHKKKQKHTSYRDKDKTRKKKHRRHKTPSSDSSLPSSDSSAPSTPSSLPSESDVDDCQVIETDDCKAVSRGSSVVSVPSSAPAPVMSNVSKSNGVKEPTSIQKLIEGTASGGEDSPSPVALPPIKAALSRIHADENKSSDLHVNIEKKTLFDPNTSSAMAKITQGLRAKLNALLEKGNKME